MVFIYYLFFQIYVLLSVPALSRAKLALCVQISNAATATEKIINVIDVSP